MKDNMLTAKEILELPVGTEVNLFKRTEIPFSREHVEKFMGWTKYMHENNNDVFHEIVFPCIIEGFEDTVVLLKGQEQTLVTWRIPLDDLLDNTTISVPSELSIYKVFLDYSGN
jgi:hypothetical protein